MGILVIIMDNEVFTNTEAIAKGVNHTHETVLKLLRNSFDLEQLSDLKSRSLKTKGRSKEVYDLTEEQATLLIALMKNTPIVRQFKSKLVKEFYKQRKILNQLAVQKNNAEWIQERLMSKTVRKECTEIIQQFIEYAKEQGSKSADKYYMNFSRMELSGLFILEDKYPNARDIMSIRQLHLIEMADEAVAISLHDSMSKGIHYKECYKIAKEKIELLAKIFPPSPLPQLLMNKKEQPCLKS